MITNPYLSVKVRWAQLSLAISAALFLVAGALLLVSPISLASSTLPPDLNVKHSSYVPPPEIQTTAADQYIVLAWNDLGMHCYNRNFQDLAVLPPYNNLWAQVIRVGNPPQVITAGITVSYSFPDNTYSVGKSNFWTYDQQLFGVNLPDNIGLKNKGLFGTMDLKDNHFTAEGIPLTEFSDSAPNTPYPYQLATIIARDTGGAELARATVVAPVSTEMHCDYCHSDHGIASPDIATGVVERNILTLHDREEMEDYPSGHPGPLMGRRPVLCAECHASNALGAPGVGGLPSLSNAMHDKHQDVVHPGLTGCYSCHPGPRTQCLRDVMATKQGMDCINCHGSVAQVAQNPNPWLNEPRCDNVACHGSGYAQNQPLYRHSQGHGGVYCEGCHDSTHAIAPSRQPNDNIKFLALQGNAGYLYQCTVCHTVQPTAAGPHGKIPPGRRSFSLIPNNTRLVMPGTQVIYTHLLRNTGNLTDTYNLTWSNTQGWAVVVSEAGGTVQLASNQTTLLTVTVTIPNSNAVKGLTEMSVITATSTISPELVSKAVDTFFVSANEIYLPIILR